MKIFWLWKRNTYGHNEISPLACAMIGLVVSFVVVAAVKYLVSG